jgi:hypothetical protein
MDLADLDIEIAGPRDMSRKKRSTDDKGIERDARIPRVVTKPKARPVPKNNKGGPEAGGEELEDAGPFGMSHAK